MAETIVELLTDVADAIREKKGSTEKINAQNFANEIKNLPSGGGEGDNGLADALVKRTITEYVNNEITEIGAYAFYSCVNMTKCRADNVTKVANACFGNCASLTSVILPNVQNISISMVSGCASLLEIELPSVSSVGAQGLRGTPNIRKISLSICTNIGALGLADNKSLTTLILGANSVCSLGNVSAFTNTPIANGTGYIYVPDDLVEAYKGATNWSTFASQIKGLSELPNE